MRILRPLPGILTALLAAGSLAPGDAMAAEPPAIAEAAVDRMIGLNRKAYVEIQEQHFQAAKYHLAEALVISETAGLETDEMTARTYVHLAAVHLAGFKDRDEALRDLKAALKIDPNITITAGLESPSLKLAYLQAREQLGLPPNPDRTAPLFRMSEPGGNVEVDADTAPKPVAGADGAEDSDEPDVPARVPLPVYCALPFDVPAGQDVVIRCLTQKQQKKASASFHYRSYENDGGFTTIPMQRTAKGWLVAVIPAQDVQGRALEYFVDAQIPLLSESLFFGRPESPNALPIRQQTYGDDLTDEAETAVEPEPAPAAAAPARLGRLRMPGTLWVGMAGGTGVAYHGHEAVDSNAKAPNTTTPVRVQSGFSAASLFQVEPELGYQVTRRFALSLMARYQYAPNEGDDEVRPPGESPVKTSAFAAFVRGHMTFLARGRFESSVSVGAGGGTSFLAVVPRHCRADACTLDHSDTVHGGALGLLGGVGAVYRLSKRVGLAIDVREIVTMPKIMAATEVSLGVIFAEKLRTNDDPQEAHAPRRNSWR